MSKFDQARISKNSLLFKVMLVERTFAEVEMQSCLEKIKKQYEIGNEVKTEALVEESKKHSEEEPSELLFDTQQRQDIEDLEEETKSLNGSDTQTYESQNDLFARPGGAAGALAASL